MMRWRDETLPTGRLLAHFAPDDRSRNRSLLFLVTGAADIEPLTRIEEVCQAAISELGLTEFEWHAVPDQGLLTSIDPNLAPAKVTRLEVAELGELTVEELDELLRPVLPRIALGEPELFPSAGGAVGAPAEGIQLLGRERELAEIARRVDAGQSILLVAPRRSGKTSVLRCLENQLRDRYRTAYLDLERFLSPEDLASRLWVLASGERVRVAQQRAASAWRPLFSDALRLLAGGDPSRPLLLLLDELVFFLRNLVPAEKKSGDRRQPVLDFLKDLSDLCLDAGARVVIAGSLELTEYLEHELGLELDDLPTMLRTLVHFPLPPPTFKSGRLEMRRVLLGTGLVVGSAELDWLVENADLASPFAALRFLDQLAARARVGEVSGIRELEAELDSFLSKTEAFQDSVQRLEDKARRLPGAKAALEEALDRLAGAHEESGLSAEAFREPLSRSRPAEADRLLTWLIENFPIRREEDQIAFASRLFHRWWRRQLADDGQEAAR
jgi:hypothetical protein